MNEKKEITAHPSTFESIRKVNQSGQDFWSARELGKILGYLEYRNFLPVIAKAKEACQNSSQKIEDHFVDIHEMVGIGSGATREMPSIAPVMPFHDLGIVESVKSPLSEKQKQWLLQWIPSSSIQLASV